MKQRKLREHDNATVDHDKIAKAKALLEQISAARIREAEERIARTRRQRLGAGYTHRVDVATERDLASRCHHLNVRVAITDEMLPTLPDNIAEIIQRQIFRIVEEAVINAHESRSRFRYDAQEARMIQMPR